MSPINSQFFLGSSFRKVDAEQRLVEGYASTAKFDSTGESITLSAVKNALDQYLKFPAVRLMHQLNAIGSVREAKVDSKGLWITAYISDDDAWKAIKAGTLRGFSVGGKTLKRNKDNPKIIEAIQLTEISIVDVPANDEATLVFKAAGPHVRGAADRVADASTGSRTVAKLPDESGVKSVDEMWEDHHRYAMLVDAMPDGEKKWEARGELRSAAEKILAVQFTIRNAARLNRKPVDPVKPLV